MEVRPIDANELQERLKRKTPEPGKRNYVEGFNDCLMRVKSMVHSAKTLNYEPVVHAHWERHYTFTDGHNKKHYWGYHCSSCGKGWIEAQPERHYRCYYCGAKMDEEQK